ncbi:hypothetical protein F5879DRAFT_920268 [Lentinula edodes]|nr:hypothetical protein F5879DRAFT_920268 [Lentinula edodes]
MSSNLASCDSQVYLSFLKYFKDAEPITSPFKRTLPCPPILIQLLPALDILGSLEYRTLHPQVLGTLPLRNQLTQTGSSPGHHDDPLELFFNATKSQIDHFPKKTLDGIIHAVKVWKAAATHTCQNRSTEDRSQQDEDQVDDFFQTELDFDSEECDMDDSHMSDCRSGSDFDKEIEIIIHAHGQQRKTQSPT